MKTKVYQRPTMMVVKLQHHGMLMTSGEQRGRSSVQDYNVNEYYEE